MRERILVVDDDRDLCRLLGDELAREGYEVTVCHDGISGADEACRGIWQLIILDIMLPRKNGYEVLAQIREKSVVPILMLTARDSEGDKVSGLRMGADDYLTKPFAGSELLARVSSLLRRYTVFNAGGCANRVIAVGDLSIDTAGREVRRGNRLLELTAKEFDLLLFLARNQGQVFTKKQIYHAVWKEEYAYDDNNIMVHIRRLRKKLEDNPENPEVIRTVWGVGYKFDAASLCGAKRE
ncbi:MAG: response regulator transcription factor [Roseburia sp.]|nr:response regulator transcription factor [Roseburia sp.]